MGLPACDSLCTDGSLYVRSLKTPGILDKYFRIGYNYVPDEGVVGAAFRRAIEPTCWQTRFPAHAWFYMKMMRLICGFPAADKSLFIREEISMSLIELFLIAVGLSMDAFAVSICKGLSMQKLNVRHAVIIGLYFGGFQALMPLFGYMLGVSFQEAITTYDHWAAFILLAIIGGNMIREALNPEEENCGDSVSFREMLPLAIATSIDALAVGVTFAFLRVHILPAVSFIGVVTFCLSIVGVKVGNLFGVRYKSKAEIVGGAILIMIGAKILLEHLFA